MINGAPAGQVQLTPLTSAVGWCSTKFLSSWIPRDLGLVGLPASPAGIFYSAQLLQKILPTNEGVKPSKAV